MSKEKQIEEMSCVICDECRAHTPSCECIMCDAAIESATAIYNAGFRKQSEWISVEEGLPSESGVYLVYRFTGNRLVLNYSARYKVFNAFDDLTDKIANSLSIKVTHWMPLPEPPKGEE